MNQLICEKCGSTARFIEQSINPLYFCNYKCQVEHYSDKQINHIGGEYSAMI
jgi:predicted nucleic-acid-binding Zn-ribbon protein